jgi:hypothetical protein
VFQPGMIYLSAAKCATAPENIVFKLSGRCELPISQPSNAALYQSMIAPPPKHNCALVDALLTSKHGHSKEGDHGSNC